MSEHLTICPAREPVLGAPHQPGDVVRVIASAEPSIELGVHAFVGRSGVVEHLEYSCGCGQSYPGDPMIGVRFPDGMIQEFWREELRGGPS